jgi:Family of unknown function (DUF5683)
MNSTKLKLPLLFALLLIISGIHLCAQTDSAAVKNTTDTTLAKLNKLPPHPPKKAALMSACLPGLGQAYNKKYWKIPIIYAGFGGLGYSFGFNQIYFKRYRDALRLRYDNDPNTTDIYPFYSDDDLVTLKQFYQRWRDLSIIGMAALYTLNIIDASVDAHLFYFNVSDDLSLRAAPFMIPTAQGPVTGFGLQLSWH